MPTGVYTRTVWHKQRFLETRPRGWKHKPETIEKMRQARLKNPIKQVGKDNYFWKNGKYKSRGYIMIWIPDHPNATKDNYVPEHRLVIEQIIGRYLEKHEIVHHLNHKRDDNRPENLELMTKHEHDKMHTTERHRFQRRFSS